MKKWIWLPLVYHTIVFIYALVSVYGYSLADGIVTAAKFDMPGIVLTPLFISFIALKNALAGEENVFDCLIMGIVVTAATALERVGVYHFVLSKADVALVIMIAEFILLGLFMLILSYIEDAVKKKREK